MKEFYIVFFSGLITGYFVVASLKEFYIVFFSGLITGWFILASLLALLMFI